jgi:glucose/arabinose dehydrogenase
VVHVVRGSSPARPGRRLCAGLCAATLACGAFLVAHGSSGRAAADVPDVALTSLGTFASPLYVTSPPGDPTRVFVVERGGTVRVVKNGALLPAPFINVTDDIGQGGERGLLSIAFAPDYAISGLFYSFATQPTGTLVVWEHHAAPGADVADAGHRIVLSIPHPATNHNGGQLQFGPDGFLYIGVGDGGTGANGQNTGVLLGKILRIDPRATATAAYSIPPGQPFAAGAAPEIWAYGFRNPWRFSFDSLTGDLLIGEVGENLWEEIDQLPAGQAPGANLGWNCWEGTHPFSGGNCSVAATPPIFEYAHDATHCSISGGFIARDPTVPTLAGRYLFADYCGTGASAIAVPVGSPPDIATLGAAVHTAGFGQDSDGHLYITSLNTGGVWRVTGTGAADKPPVAAFTMSSTTPAVGAALHLDATSSTDPDGPIFSYNWDTDGDGKIDAKGVTTDVSYPTAGARAITLTVLDTVGAHSSRTQAVFVGGKTTPPGTPDAAARLRATLTAPSPQVLKVVRKRGLLVRFRADGSATWTITATLRQSAKVRATRLHTAHGQLARKTFTAHTGSGSVRLRIAGARLAGMRTLIVRVQANVRAGGQSVQRSLLVRITR